MYENEVEGIVWKRWRFGRARVAHWQHHYITRVHHGSCDDMLGQAARSTMI